MTEPDGTPPRSVAIMQPYVFPYLGYLHLIAASDVFVFYDDVTFIKKGWINRNRILLAGAAHLVTVPLAGASQNRLISDIRLSDPAQFQARFLATLSTAYRRAPYFDQGIAYVRNVFASDPQTISDLAIASVRIFWRGFGTAHPHFRISSQASPETRGLGRADRLAAITKALGGTRYVNAPGGRALYSLSDFAPSGIDLRFVESRFRTYDQIGTDAFVPQLSLIDVIMHNSPDEILEHLATFELAGS